MKIWLMSLAICFSLSSFANNHRLTKSYFDHLVEINQEWLLHPEVSPKGSISFTSDLNRIQLHLHLVIAHLKSNAPKNLNAEQLSNRVFLLGKLQQYADKQVFPINKYHSVRQPYFVDEIGTNCAVGQMMFDSGNEELVAQISKEHNYDYIRDIQTKGVQEWANEFGFTLDELKWIQPAYAPTTTIDQVLGGTNGEVTKIVNKPGGGLTIAGQFTQLNNLPCLNIGFYKDNQLSCLGNGVDGVINEVVHVSGTTYVFGALNYNGNVYPVAKYDGTQWSYVEIPGRENATCTAANFGGMGYQYELAISHSSIPHHQEIWYFLNGNTWKKSAMIKGVVLDMLSSSYGKVYVGAFDSVMVYNSTATIDTILAVKNVVINSQYPNTWYGIGNNISETVKVVAEIGNALIFGGTCSYQSGENNVCISRYFNAVLQPLMLNDSEFETYSINTLAYRNGNEFLFGGDFKNTPYIIGVHGKHLASYNLIYNSINLMATFNRPVNSLAILNDGIYIGGDFETNAGQSVNYLGRIQSPVGVEELVSETHLNVYPNPFESILNIENGEHGATFSIFHLDGRLAKTGIILHEKIEELHLLPHGSYLLQIETEKGAVVKKIYK